MGITSTVKRVKDSILSKERSREDLKIGIAGFYDRSSKLWEDVWGEVRIRQWSFIAFPFGLLESILLTIYLRLFFAL